MNTLKDRLISLDALRGFTIAAMILVNYPGSEDSVYFTLKHTVWNGLSFTDQVAPFFLFIIGVSIAFSYSKRIDDGFPRGQLYKKILLRALKIYAVGMFLNLMPAFDFHTIRWTGTLQRIAIVFPICAILFLNSGWRTQVGLAAGLLLGYYILLTFVPTPGMSAVHLEPGTNIVAWFDNLYLPGRMWRGTWDPESLLTNITSVCTTITGMLAGRLLLSQRSPLEKSTALMTAGALSAIMGYFWGLIFPVNENLWTSSFVLVTSGFAAILLGAFYYLVDIKGFTKGTRPGIIFGANAITIYFLADVWALIFYEFKWGGASLNDRFVQGLSANGCDPKFASFAYAILFVLINFFPALWLYRKKIFIKL
jgi:predicted acyltransferase